jgi:hypothetical protein
MTTRQRWATAESEAFADTGRVLPKGAAFSVPGRACVNEGIVFGAIWDAGHTIRTVETRPETTVMSGNRSLLRY